MKQHYALALLIFISPPLVAQTGISSIITSNVPATGGSTYSGTGSGNTTYPEYASTNNFTYRYGTSSTQSPGTRSISSFSAGTLSYTPKPLPVTVKMRRVNNAVVTGNRDIVFFRGARSGTAPNYTLNLNSTYNAEMESVFANNNLYNGTDNLFQNTGDANNNQNNIERVDVMVTSGILVGNSGRSGFPVFERGNYGAHEGFKVAVITSLDGSGIPNAYSNVITVNSTSYNVASGVNPIAADQYYILRRDGSANLLVSADANQGIGGVLLRFSDFGIADGATVYGYSIMNTDFAGTTGASVVDYTNATNYPTNTGVTGGIDLLAALFFVDAGTISGKVMNDADGMKNGIVDGTGTNAGGLNAILYNNTTGTVAAVVAVSADGTFNFDATLGNNYTVYISTSAATVGQTAVPIVQLPSGWVSTGEYLGAGTGSDGNVNGVLPIGTLAVPVNNANFGIERTPNTISSSTNIPDPAINSFITLNGGSNPPFFTGSDPEDMPATATLAGKTVGITSLPVQGALWYNGAEIIVGKDGINPPSLSNPFEIANFNPSLMQVKFTGTGYNTLSFNFAYIDAAGIIDPSPATYSLSWPSPLPIQLLSFSANVIRDNKALLEWSATRDIGYFEIERSADGKNYLSIGKVANLATHSVSQVDQYSYMDTRPLKEKSFYRLKVLHNDQSFYFSHTLILNPDGKKLQQIAVGPNPFNNYISLHIAADDQTTLKVKLTDMNGSTVLHQQIGLSKGIQVVNIENLGQVPAGMYIMHIYDEHNTLYKQKLIKIH